MHTMTRCAYLVAAVAVAACAGQPADNRAADEAAIRTAVREWSAAAAAKDAATFASFYAEDGVIMLANAPDIAGMAAIREGLAGMMADPNFALSFSPDTVIVARSGDLAYETGSYTMAMSGPDGAAASERGHYVVVWRKQDGGAWKVAIDVPVSDPPQS